jgi:hypothetical protein
MRKVGCTKAGGQKRKTVGGRSGPGVLAYGGHLTAVCTKHCAARFRPGRAGSRAGHWLDAPTLDAFIVRGPRTGHGKRKVTQLQTVFARRLVRPLPNALNCCPCVCRWLHCSSAVPRRRGAPSAAVCALVCPIERWEICSYQRDPASTRCGSSLARGRAPSRPRGPRRRRPVLAVHRSCLFPHPSSS